MTGIIRQGDVLLIPVASLPDDAAVVPDRVGIEIAGERTGHVHRLIGTVAVLESQDGRREFVHGGNALTHEEHRHVVTDLVWYEVRRQREWSSGTTVGRWD
jgi:hypothetical protein